MNTSKTYKPSGKLDVKALIREYTSLLSKYNELAKVYNIPSEMPINFSNIDNINDELLMSAILRLRRAIKRLEYSPLEEKEEPLTWYAIETSDAKPSGMTGIPYTGFILDHWFYCPRTNNNGQLICIPIYDETFESNPRYMQLLKYGVPYENIIFNDDNSDVPSYMKINGRITDHRYKDGYITQAAIGTDFKVLETLNVSKTYVYADELPKQPSVGDN